MRDPKRTRRRERGERGKREGKSREGREEREGEDKRGKRRERKLRCDEKSEFERVIPAYSHTHPLPRIVVYILNEERCADPKEGV